VAVGAADIAELCNTATLSIHTCTLMNNEDACMSEFHATVNTTHTTCNNSCNSTTRNTTGMQQQWQHQRQQQHFLTLTLSSDAAALGTTDSVWTPSSLGCTNPCHRMLTALNSGAAALPLAALKSKPNDALDRTAEVKANAEASRS
jgi:hypothetical protein